MLAIPSGIYIMQRSLARHYCEDLTALHTCCIHVSLLCAALTRSRETCLPHNIKMRLPKMPGNAPATSASYDHLIFATMFASSSSFITTSSCIADYTASRALHSSLTSTANTAIPPASQTPCATKTGASFCTRRTAKCPSRSSRPPATPCKRAVLPVAMVRPPHARPRTTVQTDMYSQCRL